MKILAIETSFDETACAVIQDGSTIISHAMATSHEMHEKYGGVVPEIAARRQLECIIPVITEALEALDRPAKRDLRETRPAIQASESSSDQAHAISETIKCHIDAIAVTVGPGLIGSLLVGVETAKTLAFVCRKPIIPVNHVLAHMYANFINDGHMDTWSYGQKQTIQPSNHLTIQYPAISLVVSGGHTELYLMKSAKDLTWLGGTLDDAAGECFDKTARLIGLGHGGGAAIEAAASKYPISNIQSPIKLPRPMFHDETLNFSFSGLKTAVMREWKKHSSDSSPITDHSSLTSAFAHEIQEAITDVLVEKTIRATKQYGVKSIFLSGGVAANTRLREKFSSTIQPSNHPTIFAPPAQLCTDNAVMIGAAAFWNGESTDWHHITAAPDLSVEKF